MSSRNQPWLSTTPGTAYFDGSPEVYSERSVDLRVEAPWFLTGWAWAVYAAILVGIILLLLHFIRQRRRQAQEKKEAELKELRLGGCPSWRRGNARGYRGDGP